MKPIRNRKGFTLIEVLIVVVIIGILASLILPRMLAQPERAITAEAMQYLGVIARAYEGSAAGGATVFTAINSGVGGAAPAAANASWRALGLDLLPTNVHFTYACTAPVDAGDGAGGPPDGDWTDAGDTPPNCTATRTNVPAGNAKAGGTITMQMDTRQITACDGAFYVLANSGQPNATCI